MPKTTQPLTKLIRTTEGWLVVAFNLAISIAAIFGTLPGIQAVKYAAILNTATVVSRQGLKAVASLSPYTGAPIQPTGIPQFQLGLGSGNFGTGGTVSPGPEDALPGDAVEDQSQPDTVDPPPATPPAIQHPAPATAPTGGASA